MLSDTSFGRSGTDERRMEVRGHAERVSNSWGRLLDEQKKPWVALVTASGP